MPRLLHRLPGRRVNGEVAAAPSGSRRPALDDPYSGQRRSISPDTARFHSRRIRSTSTERNFLLFRAFGPILHP